MRYGIISDIHSNLEALNEVLHYLIEIEKVDNFVCCGDIVGYGARPNECVKAIRELPRCVVVAGNHDWGAVGLEDTSFFNPIALRAIQWTGSALNKENKEYLAHLPRVIKEKRFMVVHGSPRDPINEYIFDSSDFLANVSLIDTNICFVGHSHIPLCFYYTREGEVGEIELIDKASIELNPDYTYLINCGSVGQPRDGDPRISFGIYDETTHSLTIRRMDYKIAKTQEEILRSGLPPALALRLSYGR